MESTSMSKVLLQSSPQRSFKANRGEKPEIKLGPEMEGKIKTIIRWQADVEAGRIKGFKETPRGENRQNTLRHKSEQDPL